MCGARCIEYACIFVSPNGFEVNCMITPHFSFLYNGKPFHELSPVQTRTDTGYIYTLPDGLTVELQEKQYPAFDAVEWCLYFSNQGSTDTGIIENLYDCDISVPIPADPPKHPSLFPPHEYAKIVVTTGMVDYVREESAAEELKMREQYILAGQTQTYTPVGGRSSVGILPFFEASRGEEGVLYAIGWTGQWKASFTRNTDNIRITSGVENAAFVLHPGEKYRTTSALVLSYSDGTANAYNRFRRLMKSLSPIGKGERPAYAPLAFEAFGGVPTESMLKRLQTLSQNDIRFEYFWIDAGWYGDSEKPCPDPFTGNWGNFTGNWYVNRHVHPNALQDVAAETKKAGMKMLVWFEPERAVKGTVLAESHPEWFLTLPGNSNLLLNLGDPEALDGICDVLFKQFDTLDVQCYRQDFNISPLPFWQANDPENRKGITEIAYINGLYSFWDRILERYPSMVIDNCAGGGRRIDFETMKRSVPIWRTDYYCYVNANPDIIQMQQFGIQRFLPYTGGVTKQKNDTYAARSTYSQAWVGAYQCYDTMTLAGEDLVWAKKISDEYLRIRPYLDCDFYPLENSGYSSSGWVAWQYDDPEKGEGVIMAFRRMNSTCTKAEFSLGGICADCMYEIEDLDTGDTTTVSGMEILEKGLEVVISERRSSKVLVYRCLYPENRSTAIPGVQTPEV